MGIDRRSFTKALAMSAAGMGFGVREALGAPSAGPVMLRQGHAAPLRLGIASYSLRKFPRAKAIEMVKSLGAPYINLKSMHLPYELSPQELAAARRVVEDAGVRIVEGVIYFELDTDDGRSQVFEYAKLAGMPLIVGSCEPAVLRESNDSRSIRHQGWLSQSRPGDSISHRLRRVEVRANDGCTLGTMIDVGHTVRRVLTSCGRSPMPERASRHPRQGSRISKMPKPCIVGQVQSPSLTSSGNSPRSTTPDS